jgi:hypothetical protein
MKRRHFLYATSSTLIVNTIASLNAIATTKPTARKRALLIGINDYSQTQGLTVSSLKGCTNDVLLLKKLLQHRYGFAEQDIITLTNEQATRENILKQFETHLLQSDPDDIIVFAASGHGTTLQDSPTSKTTTTGFIPYNLTVAPNGATNCITGTTFFLLRSRLKTDQVTTLFDCCYAGNIKRTTSGDVRMVRQPLTRPALYPNKDEKDYQQDLMKSLNLDNKTLQENRQTQKGTKGILLAAAAENQLALESILTPTHRAGAYTKLLTELLWAAPTTAFDRANTTVIERLAAPTNGAQQSEIACYPPDISQKSSFFSASAPTETAQGVVEQVNPSNRQITLWLGGCSTRSLTMGNGSQFRLLNANQTIATLTSPIQPDFTATATIPNDQPLPKPGTLVQQSYRAIPKDLRLKLGLDPSLGSFKLPSDLPRIDGVVMPKDLININADVIFSQMTEDLHRDQTTPAPPIGSYGLFSSNLDYQANTFGPIGETPEAAIDRLRPQLNKLLIKKLFTTMTGTTEEIDSALPGFSAQINLAQNPKTIISTPGQVKQAIDPDTEIEISINNQTQEHLELFVIGIPPQGKIVSKYDQNLISSRSNSSIGPLKIEAKDGSGIGEFLLFVSNQMDDIIQSIPELITELNNQRSPNSNPRTPGKPKHFAISLPFQINPK